MRHVSATRRYTRRRALATVAQCSERGAGSVSSPGRRWPPLVLALRSGAGVAGGGAPRGSFTGTVSDVVPEVKVGEDGKSVVEGPG